MVVNVTCNTTVYGNMVLVPIKSPGNKNEVGFAEVVNEALVVPVTPVTVIVKAEGMAPTHCATLLTSELADCMNRDMDYLTWSE